jgi:DNA-binding IclR family transcriptional regulator
LYELVALVRLKDQTVLIVDCVECLGSQLITHELNEGDTLLRNVTHL